jgi:hypothetical protein
MSTPSAVPRTAPIAIAPKPSSSRFGIPSRQNSLINVDTYRPGSLRNNGLDSPDSDSPPPSHGSHPVIPCEACRRRRIKCVMSDGDDDDSCISCQINGAECSLVTEGQYYQRKRKLNGADYYGDQSRSGSKRRYECPEPPQFFFYPPHAFLSAHNKAETMFAGDQTIPQYDAWDKSSLHHGSLPAAPIRCTPLPAGSLPVQDTDTDPSLTRDWSMI